MSAGSKATPPSGFVAFCRRDPDQCGNVKGGASVVVLNAAVWHTLWQVNTAWNTAVKPEEDAAHYGRVDYWTIPTDGYGDCEDYALAKRKSLADLGLPLGALRIALARTEDGTAHAVLDVVTDRGDYVLDNLASVVLPWTATHYAWIARQVPGKTQWAFIGSVRSDDQMTATAEIEP
ncbi:MAG: transglutaminase-like cysteine peptidase [Alphaproteobacteria bacterium]|nr:transglutaminase-like cysteine peptidase [Alphaproteobacteria bacterium]MDE1985959.1 transglutaminase-like cysteine peptidase [Alphaproteobacteria bacterium]MDE2163372.1 transglutaminase-like cysteine peptidase [Alphaproteobacteria bacterium]MDE2267280.1 transglutaminase-like cysteine peptidase [Alphaproteobacteria bacterium]